MEQVLSSFSTNLADLVDHASGCAVAIEARHRIGSSGFLWQQGYIVTAEHAIRRDEDILVILPDGNRGSAGSRPDSIAAECLPARLPGAASASAPESAALYTAMQNHQDGAQ
jgi:hypothetical protein